MIRINELKLPLDSDEADLYGSAARKLRIGKDSIKSLSIAKKSIDSRKKESILFIYAVDVETDCDEAALVKKCGNDKISISETYEYKMPDLVRDSAFTPVIAGFGPAGMFAALTLARAGLNPLVIERGRDVDSRTADVRRFWHDRKLDTDSNVQFGEGGAGTFSDGKLTTGIKDSRCRKVFTELAAHGAPQEILYASKPHIGTDRLGAVVKNIREEIISLGGQILFETTLTDIIVANGVVHGISYTDRQGHKTDFETDALILSIGHSARDTVEMLYAKGIKMMQKPFSVGARIEHPRELIDKAQYGPFAGHPALGAADYKLACHPPHGRGAYTFCMCPGGTVVLASSEENTVVVNGMSKYERDGENSNAALLVGIEPDDFPSAHPLAGMHLQREIERNAFKIGGGNYAAPAQLASDFLSNTPSKRLGTVKPSCPTGVTLCDIRLVLPLKVTETMAGAIVEMNQKLKGFALADAVLTAPETRSSSPIRILRNEFFQSNIAGLYPCGEGAGYAGGIVSAAVDGIRCAEALMLDAHDY